MIDIETELSFGRTLREEDVKRVYDASERVFGKEKSFVELRETMQAGKYKLTLKIKE